MTRGRPTSPAIRIDAFGGTVSTRRPTTPLSLGVLLGWVDQLAADNASRGKTTAGSSSEPEQATTTTVPSDPVADATAFWEALAAGDRRAAIDLVDPAALTSRGPAPFGRAHTLEGQFDWYEAVKWQWALEACAPGNTGAVECTASASDAWSEALGVEPITGTFLVRFSDEGIIDVGDQFDSFASQWSPRVFGVFAEWVEANHAEDARLMFDFEVDAGPEVLALYETNTERFVNAHSGA